MVATEFTLAVRLFFFFVFLSFKLGIKLHIIGSAHPPQVVVQPAGASRTEPHHKRQSSIFFEEILIMCTIMSDVIVSICGAEVFALSCHPVAKVRRCIQSKQLAKKKKNNYEARAPSAAQRGRRAPCSTASVCLPETCVRVVGCGLL